MSVVLFKMTYTGIVMLLRFRFSNFRSFLGEQELSMIPVPFKGASHIAANSALPVAAIYGANASGKTNVLLALKFMMEAVVDSHRLWVPNGIPRQPFVESDEALPSQFIVDFDLDGTRHQYGFAVTSTTVEDEWLYVFPKGKRQTWYSRHAGTDFVFGAKLRGENEAIRALTRRDSLFLSAAAQNNHEALSPVYRWFSGHATFVNSRGELAHPPKPPKNIGLLKGLVGYLGKADLGIVGALARGPLSNQEFSEQFPGVSREASADRTDPTHTPPKLLHQVGEKHIFFETEQESAGTLAYLRLLGPVTDVLGDGGLLCIDQIDASLHPLLVADIINLFSVSRKAENPAQLIFTAHNTALMRTLGRDQIWFTEKNNNGASHLYPLSDFKPRRQENLELGYVQGRYGAIPLIGATPTFAGTDEADESA